MKTSPWKFFTRLTSRRRNEDAQVDHSSAESATPGSEEEDASASKIQQTETEFEATDHVHDVTVPVAGADDGLDKRSDVSEPVREPVSQSSQNSAIEHVASSPTQSDEVTVAGSVATNEIIKSPDGRSDLLDEDKGLQSAGDDDQPQGDSSAVTDHLAAMEVQTTQANLPTSAGTLQAVLDVISPPDVGFDPQQFDEQPSRQEAAVPSKGTRKSTQRKLAPTDVKSPTGDTFHDAVVDLDQEVRQLRSQLADKLRLQNTQLKKMLERFDRF